MIKSATAFTYELDDAALAAREIKEQLDRQVTYLKNTVGIIMCDPEFIETGVYKAVRDALGFPVAGATTMTQAVNGEGGMMMLTVMALTSDDVFFEVGRTASISGGDILDAAKDSYMQTAARLKETPKLAFIFPPLILENAGDQYIDAFEALCPGIPVFGTHAIDDSVTYENCLTLYNGESSDDRMSYILLGGNVSPTFMVATLADRGALQYHGEITESDGHIVKQINDMKCSDYFESIGYAKNGKLDEGIQFVPFLLDVQNRADSDGVPVVRAMVCFDENGYGICRGYMFQGAVFTLTNPSKDDVMETSVALVEAVREMPEKQAVIVFSCMVRRMSFGAAPLTEAKMMVEKMDPDIPFMLAYSGGEICPTSYGGGKVTNRFHNYSMIACIL